MLIEAEVDCYTFMSLCIQYNFFDNVDVIGLATMSKRDLVYCGCRSHWI